MAALEIEPKIAAALRDSFPLADEGELSTWAEEIYGTWTVGAAVDVIERSDRKSELDKDSLMSVFRRATLTPQAG